MTAENPKITASFIVHQDFSHIGQALSSLYTHTKVPVITYVVVNVGTPSEVDRLRAAFPQVNILTNPEPLGFASNHNQVLRLAQTPYVALLNDDIILHEGALDSLLDYMENHPRTGVAGARLLNPDGTPQVAVYSDPTLARMIYKISGLGRLTRAGSPLRRLLQRGGLGRQLRLESWQSQTTAREVPIVKGAAMFVRREAYLEVGLLDETTRMYAEEIDWHWRFRKAGWSVAIVPEAPITHFGVVQQISLNTLIEDRKGILRYFIKHRTRQQALLIRLAIVVAHGVFGTLLLFRPKDALIHYRIARMGAIWHPTNETGEHRG